LTRLVFFEKFQVCHHFIRGQHLRISECIIKSLEYLFEDFQSLSHCYWINYWQVVCYFDIFLVRLSDRFIIKYSDIEFY